MENYTLKSCFLKMELEKLTAIHMEPATERKRFKKFHLLGSFRFQAEDYIRTKFDNDGNAFN